MTEKRAALGVLGAGFATVAANRLLVDRAGALPQPVAGESKSVSWRGTDVSYVAAGDETAQDVVLLHGFHAAASGREFRGIVGALASRYHVLVPDLPGFGRSDRPRVRYTGSLYEGFVREFLENTAETPIVVASSLTGSITASAVSDGTIEELVLVNPTQETNDRSIVIRELLRTPVLGEALFNALTSKVSLRFFDRSLAYHDRGSVTADVVDYQWRTAHQPNARYAPASFVGGWIEPSTSLPESLSTLDVPITLIWGREAKRPRLDAGRELASAVDATLVVIDNSALLPHDEHPNAFLEAAGDVFTKLRTVPS